MVGEFKVGQHTYLAGRMSARDSFNVARKLAGSLIFMASLKKDESLTPEQMALAFCTSSGNISDQDMDFAIGACMSVVRRRIEGDQGWAPMWRDGQLAYQDLSMPEMVQVVWTVVEAAGLVDFFSVAASTSGAAGNEGRNGSASQTEKTTSSGQSMPGTAATRT